MSEKNAASETQQLDTHFDIKAGIVIFPLHTVCIGVCTALGFEAEYLYDAKHLNLRAERRSRKWWRWRV